MEGLTIAPAESVDPTKPAEGTIEERVDTGGRTQVRLQVATPDGVPADEEKKAEEKPAAEKKEAAARPSWLPEKFATPDALKEATVALAKKQGVPSYVIRGLEASESGQEVANAYKEFEKKIDPNAGKPAEKKAEEPAGEEKKPEEKPAEEAPYVKPDAEKAQEKEMYGEYVANLLDKAGVSGQQMGEDFAKTGKIEEATYLKFEKAGVTRQFLDAFMSGVVTNATTLAQAHVAELKSSVGGDEKFNDMITWAKANMSKDDIEAYNAMVSSGNRTAAKKGVEWLNTEYKKSLGNPPKLVTDTKPSAAAGDVYESWAQVQVDMNDPRYKNNDPAFHKKVEAKLQRSKL